MEAAGVGGVRHRLPILRSRSLLILSRPLAPLPPRLLFHSGGSEFSQLRERPSRLFVIREAAGEISRRSAGNERTTPFSTPLAMS